MSTYDSDQTDPRSLDDTNPFIVPPRDSFVNDTQFDIITADYNDEDEPIVYGLDPNIEENEARNNLRMTVLYVVCGVVAAALIIVGLMVIKPFDSHKNDSPRSQPVERKDDTEEQDDQEEQEDEQPSDSASQQQSADTQEQQSTEGEAQPEGETKGESQPEGEPEGEAQPEGEPEGEAQTQEPVRSEPFTAEDLGDVVTKQDLDKLVRFLSFDGQDLSIPDADITTEVRGARVEVVHVLHDVPHAVPLTMAGNASRRAAELSNILTDRQIQGTGEQTSTRFNDVIWRIVNVEGENFIVLTYYGGYAPKAGEPLWVLMQSPYYCMSDSLYEALNHAVPQRQGNTPKSLLGAPVSATASLSQK